MSVYRHGRQGLLRIKALAPFAAGNSLKLRQLFNWPRVLGVLAWNLSKYQHFAEGKIGIGIASSIREEGGTLEKLKQAYSQFKQEQASIPFLCPETLPQKDLELQRSIQALENGEEVTLVCLPSLTLERDHIKSILGISHYETRSLWEALQATEEHVRVLFISSQKIPEPIIEELLAHLPNPQEARERLELFCVGGEDEQTTLVDRLLGNEILMQKLQKRLSGKKSLLKTFMSTEKEEKLGQEIGAPLWGLSSSLSYFHSKSGNHFIFEKANVPCADHIRDITSMGELKEAIEKLWSHYPNDQVFMFKFDHGVSGNGIAYVQMGMEHSTFMKMKRDERQTFLDQLISELQFKGEKMEREDFLYHLNKGAVFERFLDGDVITSPSGQAMIYPDGKVKILSTHEQILGECGVTYKGCIFPAKEDYRHQVQESTRRIAETLNTRGVVGPISVDFLVAENQGEISVNAIEVNIRQGGTTHPLQTAASLVRGEYDLEEGCLKNDADEKRIYCSNDNLVLENLKGREFQELLTPMKEKGLLFDKESKVGFVFHMLSAVKDYGKCGYTLIAKNREQMEEFKTELDQALKSL